MVIINPVPVPPFGGHAYTNITPFTYRDGATYLNVLESLRAYIRDVLVPLIDKGFEDSETYVNNAVAQLVSYVDSSIEANEEWTQEQIDALTTYVNTKVEEIINDSIQVQDPVVAGIFGDEESVTRGATDLLYANKATQEAVEGRLSEESLESDFVMPLATSGGKVAPLTYVNVADFGAIGDGVTDDTLAIQAAIDAAGSGGVTRLQPGKVYNVTGTLVMPLWSTLEGVSNSIGAGPVSPAEIKFTGVAAHGIEAGQYATLKHLKLRGRGSNVGSARGINGGSVTLEDISVIAWATGVYLTNAYYAHMYRCEFSRNADAVTLSGCYNVNVYSCRVYGWTSSGSIGTGYNGAARALNIFGGSIESVRTGVNVQNKQSVNMYSVYFECQPPAGEAWPSINVFVVAARDRTDASVNMQGCFVYMNYVTAVVTTVNSVNASLVAKSNHLVAGAELTSSPIYCQVSQNQALDIGPDNTGEMVAPNAVYCSATGGLPVVGGVVNTPNGLTYDGRRKVRQQQRLSGSGVITLDTAKYERFVLTLTEAATIALDNNAGRDEISISIIPGGFAYTFPANFRFAGGTAPSTTTTGTITTVKMKLDTPTGRWHEVSRSVAVPY